MVCPFIHFLSAILLAVLRFTECDCHFGIFRFFCQIDKIYVYNYTTVNSNIYTFIVVEVRSTEAHYADTIPVDQDQPYDQLVHNNPVEQEQPNAQYNTDVVDSSIEELEHPYDTVGN